jgi:hypothetical protein
MIFGASSEKSNPVLPEYKADTLMHELACPAHSLLDAVPLDINAKELSINKRVFITQIFWGEEGDP